MNAAALVRPVRDALAEQLGRSRGAQWGAHLGWSPDAELLRGLGLDSIELVEAAERISRMFLLELPGWEDYLLRDRTLHGWASVAAAALADHGDLRFSSSGSQGAGRDCVHSLAELQAEAEFFAALLAPRGTLRIAVPTHHIYGFIFGVLLPAVSGAPVVDYCGRLPSTLLREAAPGDIVVAHPLVWQALASAGHWRDGVTGVTSTAPCPADTIDRLHAAGLARMVEVYGSSETSGIGWRDANPSPFTLLPRWSLGQDAESAFLLDAAGTRLELPDHVRIEAGGIRPVGRVDEAVQVAGHNVYPARTVEALRSRGDVVAAAVRLDACSGRLKAFVVPLHDAGPDAGELRAWCRQQLGDAATPSRFTFGQQLPRNVMGKAADWD